MQEKIKQVANRIKELREIFGVSAAQLAGEFNLPEADYRQFEAGAADIPVGVLYQIAQRFHVELTTLLTGEEPRLHTYALTRAGQGVSVDRSKDYQYQSLALQLHPQAGRTVPGHRGARARALQQPPGPGVPLRPRRHPAGAAGPARTDPRGRATRSTSIPPSRTASPPCHGVPAQLIAVIV